MGSQDIGSEMKGTKMQWTCFVVMVTAVRSQDSYGSPTSSVLSPSSGSSSGGFQSSGSSSGGFQSSDSSSEGFQPSNFQTIIGSLSSTSISESGSSSFESSQTSSSSNSFSGSSSSDSSSFGSTFIDFNSGVSSSNLFSGSSPSNAFAGTSSNSFGGSSSSGSSFSPSSSGSSFGSSSGGSGFNSGVSGSSSTSVPGGVDFSLATRTEDGRLCVIKEESVETLSKDPILECKHKNIEKCHYTYITYFKPAQEETCEENFEKICQITFKQEAIRETVKKCYRPLEKVCNGQGQEECSTVYESSCSTKYVEKSPGKFVGDTKCEKLPIEICGRGCITEEGAEECHNKEIDTLVDVPEESCDLNPQKTCRLVTKLVPSLKPKKECTTIPQETCNLKFTQPERKQKPLRTEWCLDEEESVAPQPSYSSNARSGRRFG